MSDQFKKPNDTPENQNTLSTAATHGDSSPDSRPAGVNTVAGGSGSNPPYATQRWLAEKKSEDPWNGISVLSSPKVRRVQKSMNQSPREGAPSVRQRLCIVTLTLYVD